MGNVSLINGHIDEPKGMTDNEIIKALECCMDKSIMSCQECPIRMECHNYETDIKKEALDLINRQKAEIEFLKNELSNIEFLNKELEIDKKDLKAEIERLEKENQLLLDNHPANTHRNCVIIYNGIIYTKTLYDYAKFLTDVSNEAVKEFALELKRIPRMWVYKNEIDNLLKEMVGESDV